MFYDCHHLHWNETNDLVICSWLLVFVRVRKLAWVSYPVISSCFLWWHTSRWLCEFGVGRLHFRLHKCNKQTGMSFPSIKLKRSLLWGVMLTQELGFAHKDYSIFHVVLGLRINASTVSRDRGWELGINFHHYSLEKLSSWFLPFFLLLNCTPSNYEVLNSTRSHPGSSIFLFWLWFLPLWFVHQYDYSALCCFLLGLD